MSKPKKGNWIVKMKCVVEKEVFVNNCTETEARLNPWDHFDDEIETCQEDWEVISVNPNC